MDIAPSFTSEQLRLMQGGEISMWTDNYCYTEECEGGPPPYAAVLYNPDYDAEFSQSIGGMVRLFAVKCQNFRSHCKF